MTTELTRLQNFGPNWFASVMGTGIVATAGVTLPVHVPGLRGFSHIVWVLATVLLVVLIVAVTIQWARHRTVARSHVRNPQMSHFYGAAPMALMTVGAGALLTGKDLIGERVAVDLAWVLWTTGTLGGLFTAVTIPFLMFTQLNVEPDAAFGGWLMPVVPPMVSAATGALLVPYLPAHLRPVLLLACYALFAFSLVAAAPVVRAILTGPVRLAPTLWIVLGPAGQSVTAAHLLARAADGPISGAFALLYGVPVLVLALLWMARAATLTVRAAPPFAMTWWSFTFPVGTVVTGASGLAARTGSPILAALAVVLFGGLVAAWAVVAARTVRGYLAGVL
jgi:C4-dicarboxylate transporter/malic acid transport protein